MCYFYGRAENFPNRPRVILIRGIEKDIGYFLFRRNARVRRHE